jgi:GT2 family glycosyltransferase
LKKLNLCIIDTGQPVYLEQCLISLKETTSPENYVLTMVHELETREETLNSILIGSEGEDTFIVADDIIFTSGWLEQLMGNRTCGDIIGFSMLSPGDDRVHNNGYELVLQDDNVQFRAINAGQELASMSQFDYAECDAVTGCAMFLKKTLLENCPIFPPDGMNRWGENIFMHQAKNMGYKVVVLGHYLIHHGKSTKNNTQLELRTESYSFEKEMWAKLSQKYINREAVKGIYKTQFSSSIKELLDTTKTILLYGAGSVSQKIIEEYKLQSRTNLTICSGLIEEEDLTFNGFNVKHYSHLDPSDYDLCLITIVGRHDTIVSSSQTFFNKLTRVFYIAKNDFGKLDCYDLHID